MLLNCQQGRLNLWHRDSGATGTHVDLVSLTGCTMCRTTRYQIQALNTSIGGTTFGVDLTNSIPSWKVSAVISGDIRMRQNKIFASALKSGWVVYTH